MEKKMKILRESTEELRKEIMQKKLEIKNLREDLASKQKQLLKEQKELEELLEHQVVLKVCYLPLILKHCALHGCKSVWVSRVTSRLDKEGYCLTNWNVCIAIDPIKLNLGSGNSQKTLGCLGVSL